MHMKRFNKRKAIWYLMLFVIPVILYSCYPGGAEYVDELDVVGTRYDKKFDFSKPTTYMIPDTVYEIKDPDDPSKDVPLRTDLSNLIIKTIEKNMNDMGYTKLADTLAGLPDIYVWPFATSTTWVGYTWYPPSWGWYYPPGWGWYYPPGWGTYYSYETGTVVIDMLDVTNPDYEHKAFPAVWHAGCNGLVQGSNEYKNQRVENMVNQAFEQSPYLKGNN